MKSLKQGILIVFEGIDGSGKTTQIEKVKKCLESKKFPVTITHEPNHNSPYYELIKKKVYQHRDQTLPEDELELYLEDRKWDLKHNILPSLEKKHIVLVDRYYLSNAAYQGALESFSPEYILEKNFFAEQPDLWIILDVPVSIGQQRINQRDKRNKEVKNDQLEIADFQKKVRENYRKLSLKNIGGDLAWVDASGEEEELAKKLCKIITDFLKSFEILS